MDFFVNFLNLDEKIKICDSHIHLNDCINRKLDFFNNRNYFCCTCSHSINEFFKTNSLIEKSSSNVFKAFGIHPQMPILENVTFLENLLAKNQVQAVGEAGFDFYSHEFKSQEEQQTKAFEIQLELCQKYNFPIILHGRKCNDRFFFYSKKLSKLPAVIFHSYMGTYQEAISLLNRGINAYFSFSKQILNGNKKAIECVQKISCNNLLLETDAPYQTLKNEIATFPSDIFKIYLKAMELRKIQITQKEQILDFSQTIYLNFISCMKTLKNAEL